MILWRPQGAVLFLVGALPLPQSCLDDRTAGQHHDKRGQVAQHPHPQTHLPPSPSQRQTSATPAPSSRVSPASHQLSSAARPARKATLIQPSRRRRQDTPPPSSPVPTRSSSCRHCGSSRGFLLPSRRPRGSPGPGALGAALPGGGAAERGGRPLRHRLARPALLGASRVSTRGGPWSVLRWPVVNRFQKVTRIRSSSKPFVQAQPSLQARRSPHVSRVRSWGHSWSHPKPPLLKILCSNQLPDKSCLASADPVTRVLNVWIPWPPLATQLPFHFPPCFHLYL